MPDTPFGASSPLSLRVWLDIPRSITEYVETLFSIVDGVRIGKASGPVTLKDRGSVEFAGRLTAIVQNMFSETVAEAKTVQPVTVIPISGLRSFFDNDQNGSFILNQAQILNGDLLCYIRMSRQDSALRMMDRAAWLAIPSNASGFTYPDAAGVLSEAWFGDCGRDIAAVANTVFHELMHNKTRFGSGEKSGWVHDASGGGGLAAANNPGALASFTTLNKLAMARRFSIKNKQYTAGLH